jgi:sugar phosphate isomerase/epimerase
MRLGLGSYAYAWAIGGVSGCKPEHPMDAFAFIDRAMELGVRLVQIADNIPLHGLSQVERDSLLTRAQRLGLAIEVGTRGIGQDHLRTYLHIAGEFGSPILRTVTDSDDYHPSMGEIIETLCAVLPEFESAGITLAVENHDRFTAREFRHIVEQVRSPNIGICLDTVNSFGALEGPEVVVDTLGPCVVNLHIKDFSIRRASYVMGFVVEGTAAGHGRLNIPWLLDRLQRHGRDFNAVLETWPPPAATLADTIQRENEWAATSIAYLRTLIPE